MAKSLVLCAFNTKDLKCIEKLLGVMNNENILEKDKKVMVARLPIKSIDEIELIKDLYRKKNQLQELSILSFSSSLKFKGEVCL